MGAFGTPGAVLGIGWAGACLGFLFWNWAPAHIFLGDVGSGALGVLGVVGGVLVLHEGEWAFLAVFLPLVPIFLDASVTLLRRAWAGEKVYKPHRVHLYQRLANGGWGHSRVTWLYAAASAVGVAVAHTASTPAWPAILAAYIVLILGTGAALDRRVPLAISG